MPEDTHSERLTMEILLARIQALEERADAQTRCTETLVVEGDRGEVTGLGPATDGPETASGLDSALVSRRGLLRAAVLGAAGVAGIDAMLHPEMAAAMNGDPVVVGGSYTGTFTTAFTITGGANALFASSDTGTGVYAISGFEGVYASGGTYGVYGYSGSSIGIYGQSTSGTGVEGISGGLGTGVYGINYDDGGSFYIGVLGQAQSGTGVYGKSTGGGPGVIGESTSDKGVIGTSTSGDGVYGHSASGNGVVGQSDTGIGLEGISGGSQGVYGTSTSNYGVYGTSGSSAGVYGNSTVNDGVSALGGRYGGAFNGGLAPLFLLPGGSLGAPTAGTHALGEMYVDINGVFYICAMPGSPGTWMQLGGIGLQSFPNPRRVFHQLMTSGQIVTGIDATMKTVGGASGVPAGARAMYAAVQSDQPGRLTLYPNGTTDPGIATWTNGSLAGTLFLSYMLVPQDATGKFSIHSYISGNVYVDAWGYLP